MTRTDGFQTTQHNTNNNNNTGLNTKFAFQYTTNAFINKGLFGRCVLKFAKRTNRHRLRRQAQQINNIMLRFEACFNGDQDSFLSLNIYRPPSLYNLIYYTKCTCNH